MPLPSSAKWTLAIAFFGGLVGGDVAVALAALAAFLHACASPRLTWRGAILSVSGWAAGTLVAGLLTIAGARWGLQDGEAEPVWAMVMLSALASAYLGTALTWAAWRLERERDFRNS